MPSSAELYPLVHAWVQALPGPNPLHPAALSALAHLVTAVLVGQSLRPSALMRALLSPSPVPARQRYKRVARAWTRPWLSPAWLVPRLVRAALALVAPDPPGYPTAGWTHLALDTVRCGRWEVVTLGVVWHGRVLPVGWTVLPYPLPKGQFTPAVCALLRQVAAVWPAERPAHVVADRGFPSRLLFRTLAQVGWGWTVRLRAGLAVTVAGQARLVRAQLAHAQLDGWTATEARYGSGADAVAGTLVVGRGLVVLPAHQRGAGSLRHRARRLAEHQHNRHARRPRRAPDGTGPTGRLGPWGDLDVWVVLFTSHPTWRAAGASYRRRWAAEGSYRDAQSGWDGQHGWALDPALARLSTARQVERVVGLWALATLVQTWVGDRVGQATAPLAVQAVVREWTTTGRLSVWARGRLALTEPSGQLRGWLTPTLLAGAGQVAAAPPPPVRVVSLPERAASAPARAA